MLHLPRYVSAPRRESTRLHHLRNTPCIRFEDVLTLPGRFALLFEDGVNLGKLGWVFSTLYGFLLIVYGSVNYASRSQSSADKTREGSTGALFPAEVSCKGRFVLPGREGDEVLAGFYL